MAKSLTAKNIIQQAEHLFGRQPESYMLRLINDAQNWDLTTQKNDAFAIYDQTNTGTALSIAPSTYAATFAGTTSSNQKVS